jgi:hypothetical protein
MRARATLPTLIFLAQLVGSVLLACAILLAAAAAACC